jgi:hypothetical protein
MRSCSWKFSFSFSVLQSVFLTFRYLCPSGCVLAAIRPPKDLPSRSAPEAANLGLLYSRLPNKCVHYRRSSTRISFLPPFGRVAIGFFLESASTIGHEATFRSFHSCVISAGRKPSPTPLGRRPPLDLALDSNINSTLNRIQIQANFFIGTLVFHFCRKQKHAGVYPVLEDSRNRGPSDHYQ